MPEIKETSLPGVGQRVEFTSDEGNRIGVVHHKTGRRELFVCSPSDPDAVTLSLRLTDDESHALADVLGGSSVIESLEKLGQQIAGLAIDWLKVSGDSAFAGKTIGDSAVRERTGASIVAVIRGDSAHPAPGPDFELQPDDELVVVGTAEGIRSAQDILTAS